MSDKMHNETPSGAPGSSNKTLFWYLAGLTGFVFVIVVGGRLFVHALHTSVGMNESVALLLFGVLFYGAIVLVRKIRA
jgi:hypothetical protein